MKSNQTLKLDTPHVTIKLESFQWCYISYPTDRDEKAKETAAIEELKIKIGPFIEHYAFIKIAMPVFDASLSQNHILAVPLEIVDRVMRNAAKLYGRDSCIRIVGV